MMVNGENVETLPHQEVVEKLRQLNEEADSISLCVTREEIRPLSPKIEVYVVYYCEVGIAYIHGIITLMLSAINQSNKSRVSIASVDFS